MPFLTAITIQATLVLLAAFALALMLRRASAAARHLLWMLALAAVMALPLLWLAVPRVPVVAHPVAMLVQEMTVTAQGVQAPPAPRPGAPIVLYVWLAGAVAALVRLLRVAILSRRAIVGAGFKPALQLASQLGIRRQVIILRSDRTTIPLAWAYARCTGSIHLLGWPWRVFAGSASKPATIACPLWATAPPITPVTWWSWPTLCAPPVSDGPRQSPWQSRKNSKRG